MLDSLIDEMNKELSLLRADSEVQKIYRYFHNKTYVIIFIKQYSGLISNLQSTNLLLNAGFVEDAFTIYRKYLETFFVLLSVIKHPDLAESYVLHDGYISMKVCKQELNKIRQFTSGKPEGFLEYGYLEPYVKQREDMRYTTRDAAEVGGAKKWHYLYKMSSDFVHNNFNAVSVDLGDAQTVLVKACKDTVNYLNKEIERLVLCGNNTTSL